MRSLPILVASILAGAGLAGLPSAALAEEPPFLTLASTTSTRDSGLLDALLPLFQRQSGAEVRVVAVGTGRALELGRRGDVDALLVHDRASEDAFVEAGDGEFRRDVMYNDFVIVGPASDPAGVRGMKRAIVAFKSIADSQVPFLSRGDDSGTHKAELRLWTSAVRDPSKASGTWYRETGNGMGATLNTAAELEAYTLADRGTWLSFKNPRELEILVEGDPPLRNPYGVIVVDPGRHPHVKHDLAVAFADWLVSQEAQDAIGAYRVNDQPLFFPTPSEAGSKGE